MPDMGPEDALILVVGGIDPKQMHAEVPAQLVQSFDPLANEWSLLTKLPDPRHHHGCVMLDGYLYVIGEWVNSLDFEFEFE
jgi:hypothetical protein